MTESVPPTAYGLNIGFHGPVTPSADVCWAGEPLHPSTLQTTLAEDHEVGSGIFHLTSSRVGTFAPEGEYRGIILPASHRPVMHIQGLDGEMVLVHGYFIQDTDTFVATAFQGGAGDQPWPAGTPMDRAAGWINWSTVPAERVLAPSLVVGGRDTGYPAGLHPHQNIGFNCIDALMTQLPAGDYAPRAQGTGRVRFDFRFRDRDPISFYIAFVAGVPVQDTIPIESTECNFVRVELLESSFSDPIHAVRLFKPGTVAAFDAQDDPYFDIWDEDYIGQLRDGGWIRLLDIEGTNFSKRQDWGPSDEAMYRKVVAVANAADCHVWSCVSALATDKYVEALVAYFAANLKPGLRLAIENSNERWNGLFIQHYFARTAGSSRFTPLRAESLTSDGTTVTVHRPGHGLSTGTLCVIAGATDPRYNGDHVVTRVDDDRVTYTPKTPPPAGSAVALDRDTQPLVCFDPAAAASVPISGAAWKWDAEDGLSHWQYDCESDHGYAHEDIVLLSGFADPNANVVCRIDPKLDSDPGYRPRTLFQLADRQGRHCTPTATGPDGRPIPLTAAPGCTIRATRLAGYGGPSHVLPPVPTSQRWHAYRTQEIADIAHQRAPGLFGGAILGLWAGSGINEECMDFLLKAYGGAVPSDYPVYGAIAPYIGHENPAGISDAVIAPGLVRFTSVTASGGVATISGPYQPVGGSFSPYHGLPLGPIQLNVCNVHPADYCGPVTATVVSPTQITFPLPAGANPDDGVPKSNRIAMHWMTMPCSGREVTGFERSGDTLKVTSPRHGFVPGQRINIGGFYYASWDGEFDVLSVPTPDTFTVASPGTAYTSPTPGGPDGGYRPWAFDHEIVDRLLDDVEMAVRGRWVSGICRPFAEHCRARGMIPSAYEFASGFSATQPYWNVAITDWVYQAGNLSDRIAGIYDECHSRAHALGYSLWIHYQHVGTWSFYGSWPPRRWQQDDSPRWPAIQRARAWFGHAMDDGPSFDVTPTAAEAATPIVLTLEGDGTNWSSSSTASAVGGSVAGLTVLSPTLAKVRFTATAAGVAAIGIDGAWRRVVVYDPPPRSLYLDSPYLLTGVSQAFKIRGVGTDWGESSDFTMIGATLSDVTIVGPEEIDCKIATGPEPGWATLDDGQGTQLRIPIEREVIIDDDGPDSSRVGGWLENPIGLGKGRRFRPGADEGASVSWTMVAPIGGHWTYALNWGDGGAPDITYEVRKGERLVATHVVDQRRSSIGEALAGEQAFQVIGGIDLAEGDVLEIRLLGAASGWVQADACRFATRGPVSPPPSIVVDEIDRGPDGLGYSETGDWSNTWGGLRHAARIGSAAADPPITASWKALAPVSGDYEVFLMWRTLDGSAADVPVILSVDGAEVARTTVDQRIPSRGGHRTATGFAFQSVGRVVAEAGQVLGVLIEGRGGVFVVADAAKWALVEPAAPPPIATGFSLSGPASLALGTTGTYSVAPVGGAPAVDTTIAFASDDGGQIVPATRTFAAGSVVPQTFAFTPASAGTITLRATPAPTLGSPQTLAVAVAKVPSTLVPGSITFGPPTQTTVQVGLSGTSGDVPPYSIQFQRASDSGGIPGTWADVGFPGTASTLSVAGLTPGTRYWFRARVVPKTGPSATSAAASVTTAQAPPAEKQFLLILNLKA